MVQKEILGENRTGKDNTGHPSTGKTESCVTGSSLADFIGNQTS